MPAAWRLPSLARLDALAPAALGIAIAVYVALELYVTRGTSFTADETQLVANYRGLGLGSLLAPQNAHLIAVLRLIYGFDIDVFDGSYTFIRIVEMGGVIATAALVFVFARRRLGAAEALVPSVILLFLGSSKLVVSPLGIAPIYAIAFGLGALVALERRDLRGDVVAAVLLVASVATYSVGLSFLVGCAVWILLAPDRRRRAWVFLVPLVLYATWFIWARKFDQGDFAITSLLLIPNFAAESLAAVCGAITGLNYPFGNEIVGPEEVALGPGRVVAALTLGFVVWLILRRPPSWVFWGLLAVLFAFWASIALSPGPLRTPGEARYLYPGAVALILVVAEAARGMRRSPAAVAALLVLGLLTLGSNLMQFKAAGAELRETSARTRVVLAMYELAGENGNPGYSRTYDVPVTLGEYRDGAPRNGSYAISLTDLAGASPALRSLADETLVGALGLSLEETPVGKNSSCKQVEGAGSSPRVVQLAPGGGVLRSASPATVSLGRFADAPSIPVGELPGGNEEGGVLFIPDDGAAQPWVASVDTPGAVSICRPPPASAGD